MISDAGVNDSGCPLLVHLAVPTVHSFVAPLIYGCRCSYAAFLTVADVLAAAGRRVGWLADRAA
jgi:hypothetical protein